MFVRMRQQSYLYELAALFIGLLGLQVATAADERGNLTVRTITGVYTGLVNEDYTNVREFRSIPYAQPPVGSLRWMPPVAVAPSGKHRYSQRFGPTCPQYMTKNLTLWNSNITDFKIDMGGQSNTIGAMAQTSTEDCLSLAIWTPLNISSNDSLPVAIFIPGGSFTGGGITVPYQNPAPFVSRHNNIIVVTLNYRVTIMGFPHAAALDDHNLGIMDQRMAVEWVKANIANFGGDPDRMILWGQSAGAVSADVHSWAYYDNPLVRGYFLHSGTAAVQKIPADPTYTNFTFVARNLGCDFANDPAAELACMRQVPLSQIMNFVGQYQENNTKPSITFKLIPDDKIFFNNYSARAEAGLMAKVPALISTTSNEDSSLYDYPVKDVAAGPNMTDVDLQTIKGFVCLASNTTNWRAQNNLTTYRFQYAGNFSSVTPLGWMGAYHASDIPMIFGTYQLRPGITDEERKTAETMQDYVAAFIADPENGLRNKGWPPMDKPVAVGGTMLRFAAQHGPLVQEVSTHEVDDACVKGAPYNRSP